MPKGKKTKAPPAYAELGDGRTMSLRAEDVQARRRKGAEIGGEFFTPEQFHDEQRARTPRQCGGRVGVPDPRCGH